MSTVDRKDQDRVEREHVSETSQAKPAARSARKRSGEGNAVTRLIRSISLFVRQILDELRKVVRPTGSELVHYTVVVILFVITIMAIVSGLDWIFRRIMVLAFAGG